MYYFILSCYICVGIGMPHGVMELGDVITLLKTPNLEVTLDSQDLTELFVSAEFEPVEQSLILETTENIHSLLVYNEEGNMEFMLPVMASKVTLGKSMFEAGKYRLGFNFENYDELKYANIAMR